VTTARLAVATVTNKTAKRLEEKLSGLLVAVAVAWIAQNRVNEIEDKLLALPWKFTHFFQSSLKLRWWSWFASGFAFDAQ